MGRSRVLTIIAVLGVMASVPAARGAEPNLGTLSDTNGTVSWSGLIDGPTLAPSDPGQCGGVALERYLAGASRMCDRFTLFLNLPADTWAQTPGSVEFAIRWDDYDSTERDLDLYVLDSSGAVVAKSSGMDSEAEVAFLHAPPNGLYDVVVAASTSPDPIEYDGRIEVEPDPVLDTPGHDLLPDLVSLAPKTVMVGTGEYYISLAHNPAVSCYPEETTDTTKGGDGPPLRCLRFDQIVANLGQGRLELRFDPGENFLSPTMWQRIYRSDGSTRDVIAGVGEFHPVHAHWHYTGFGLAALYDTAGNRVSLGRKRGFCMVDVLFAMWGQKGNDPRRTSFPGCQLPGADGWITEGMDVGWADNYNWFLADQYLDVTNVPNGHVYRLDVIANPNAIDAYKTPDTPAVLESDITNNVSHTWVCLRSSGATIVAGPDAPCPES